MGSRAGSQGADQGLERKIELVHIEPGRPAQNVIVESFHGKLRDECLNASWFGNLFEARVKIGAWKEEYNEERPHSSLGYLTPREFSRRMAALRSQKGFDRADIVRDVRLSWHSLFE